MAASAVMLVVGLAATAAGLVMQPLSAARAAQLSRNVDQHVIVLCRNQPRAAPEETSTFHDRVGAISGYQQPLLSELRQVHTTHVQPYTRSTPSRPRCRRARRRRSRRTRRSRRLSRTGPSTARRAK